MFTRFTVEEHATSAVLYYCTTLVAGTAFSLGVVVKLLLQLLQESAHNTHTKFSHCPCAIITACLYEVRGARSSVDDSSLLRHDAV